MGKKVKNPKLIKQQGGNKESVLSVFNRFANRVAESHKKKIEKVGDTKQRLMEAKKTNKMIKVSKRTSKFALIDDEPLTGGLTHKGKSINELKQFNDMNFGSDVEDDEFLKAHENLNFTGFDDDEPNDKGAKDPERPKTKAEIYKEIIDKSKLHKHIRQQIYEQNFEKAVELDNQFPQLVSKLKFRTRDSNVKDRLANADHEFEKLANELKEDEKVVSNKVMEKNEKYTDKVKRKKNQQLNSLMKDSSDSEDIREWAKNANQESELDEEDEQDEIDDVQLSSEEQSEGQEEEGDEQEDEGEDDSEQLQGQQDGEEELESQQSGREEQESQQEPEEEPQSIKVSKNKKNIAKPVQKNRPAKFGRKK